ncbi:flagellar hook-associated protein FlgL [Porticoccaceae bacterium]|jgi:flagellar hook-associated protein 3 FlgL|nr:flagellar hook-associated protein FlgL [Porticoccaceae bacterium]MBT6592414.1 flagellar hook-associated protein FlgL [Porticoccaceae bacterium]MDB4260448.1 flagellar hook-associated protein FlgL [Porticoccaceae bacterium]
MKVSTSQIFERATTQMAQQQSKVAAMQTQLATGKQVLRPSDSPEQAGMIQRLSSALNRQDVYSSNLDAINSRLGAEEAALMSSEDVMQRVRELAVQASSDTMSDADRKIIASEVTALRDQLLSLANAQDVSGNYVFSGSMVRDQPFTEDAAGNLVYQGDQNRMLVDVSDQRQLALNRPGNEVFSSVIRETDGVSERVGFFQVIDDFNAALLNQDSGQLQNSLAEVSELTLNMAVSIADVGSRLRISELQTDSLADAKLRYQTLLSGAEDLDYATAITQLTSEIMSLEAGQSSFAKISQLTLFDYIR